MKQTMILLTLIGLLILASAVYAQTGNGYKLTWWTVDGGGATVQGGEYLLNGTIGQPEPGPELTGDDYKLVSGFWFGASAPPGAESAPLYLPLVQR